MTILRPDIVDAATSLRINGTEVAGSAGNGAFSFLNVGNSTSSAVADGDLAAGDGTLEMFWDASAGQLTFSGYTGSSLTSPISISANVNNRVQMLISNTNSGAGPAIQFDTDSATPHLLIGSTGTAYGSVPAIGPDNTYISTMGELIIYCETSERIVLGTQTNQASAFTNRIQMTSDGHWAPVTTNTPDLGTSSLRWRTAYLGTSLNVGTSITDSTDNGDIVAGDGIREFRWDASANTILIGAEATSAIIQGVDATTAATAGTNLDIRAGNGLTNGEGGILDLLAGTSPSGTPGVVQVNSLPLPTTLSTTVSIDVTTTGTTGLYTVPTGRSAVITAVIIRPTTATAVNADGVISVGTNASTYDDIIAATTLTGLDATTEHFVATPGGVSHTGAAAEVITFQVDTAETGTDLTVTVDLIGYLL